MKKRLLSLLLTLVMILGMIPATTLTANAAGGFIEIGDVKLYAGQYLKQGSLTSTTTKPADNYAYFDGTTLELHNYTKNTWIDARFDFVIELFGYNKVDRVRAYDSSTVTRYDLTIRGNGTLCVYDSNNNAGISVRSLRVESGNLDIISTYGAFFFQIEEVTYPVNAIALCSQNEAGTWEPFDFDKVIDNYYKRVMIISGVSFGSQSPAMPEGETSHDLGTVAASNYPISFQGEWMGSFTSAGYTLYETLTVLNSKSQVVYDKSQKYNGEGLTYDLKDLPDDRYVINETLTVRDANDDVVFNKTHTFTIDWKPAIYISYVDVYDIALPEAFTNPDFTYNDEEGAAYHWDVVQVEWFECDKDGRILSGALTKNDVFQKDTYYRVEVTVVPETNWKFHDTDLDFYINDDAAMPLYGYNKAYPDSVTGYLVYNTADIEGDYELFVYDDSLSGSAKNIYIKDGQYLGSNATGATAIKPASGGYAYYKDGVLELNGYKNEKAHFIFEELALELYLVGDNTIGAIYDNEWGMAGGNLETRQGNLVIDAADGGKLTIASNPLDAYANIQVKDLYFKGGDVTSCLANGTYGAAVQLNGGNLYLENGYVAYVSNTNNFATATKWDGKTNIGGYDCVWIVDEKVSGSGVTVNCIGDIDYTVSGNVVTVDHEVACKVGYLDGAAYKAIAAVANGNGTYSFTAPAGVTEVLLVVKGDVSGDGRVNMGDVSKLYAHIKGTNMLTGVTLFVADISDDGRINMGDVSKLYAHIKGTNLLTWDT